MMQFPKSKDHLENVKKVMNCNQMKQLALTSYGSSIVQMLGGLHVILAVVLSVTET